MQKQIFSLMAAFMLLTTLTPKPAEAFLKFRTNYFSSPVKGTILYNGEPVEGALVKRTVVGAGNNPDDRHEDETMTDKNGQFHLPEVTNKTFILRPHIFSASPGANQLIHVIYNDEKYAIWSSTKTNFNKGVEDVTSFDEIILTCELTNNDGKSERFGTYTTKCEVEGSTK